MQKKTNQRLQTDCDHDPPRVEVVEIITTQQDDSKLEKCESSDTSAQSQSAVLEKSAHVTFVEQTNINSLIGMPFIIRSHQEVESKLDENPKGTRRLKSDDLRQSSGSVRGILRINPSKLNNGTGVTNDGLEVKDMSPMNEIDWPSISKEGHNENIASNERDSKSWSTVLRTVTLPKPNEKVRRIFSKHNNCSTPYASNGIKLSTVITVCLCCIEATSFLGPSLEERRNGQVPINCLCIVNHPNTG